MVPSRGKGVNCCAGGGFDVLVEFDQVEELSSHTDRGGSPVARWSCVVSRKAARYAKGGTHLCQATARGAPATCTEELLVSRKAAKDAKVVMDETWQAGKVPGTSEVPGTSAQETWSLVLVSVAAQSS